jgi:hypothetical protein
MRIDELLYFAPGITFDQVDFSGERLPEQLAARVRGFYLEPARLCAAAEHGFAAGVVLLACVDALARWTTGSRDVDARFISFAQRELPSFAEGSRAEQLYTAFRNGLVHEGRIKAGAQFSFDFQGTCEDLQGVLVINPTLLAREIDAALTAWVAELRSNRTLRAQLARRLAQDHKDDRRFAAPP